MTEHTANQALAHAAQRIEWEQAHMQAAMQPSTCKRTAPSGRHATDYVLLAMLASIVSALLVGWL